MDALTALHTRVSVSRMTDPAPDLATLDNIFKAALRAADHALLRPWRFLVIRGTSRNRLAEVFAQATLADSPECAAEVLSKVRFKPLRAPLIVVGIVSPRNHPKVPLLEQQMSAAAAMQNMLTAAHAQGIGAIWRTGSMAHHPLVKQELGLDGHEEIAGFLYMGHAYGPSRPFREESTTLYFQDW